MEQHELTLSALAAAIQHLRGAARVNSVCPCNTTPPLIPSRAPPALSPLTFFFFLGVQDYPQTSRLMALVNVIGLSAAGSLWTLRALLQVHVAHWGPVLCPCFLVQRAEPQSMLWGILRASLSGTFLQTARFSYTTEGALFISAQLSSDAVSALRKVRVLIWL